MQHDTRVVAPPADSGKPQDAATRESHSVLHRPVGPGMIIAIILGVIVVRGWLIEGLIVDGHSMYPALYDRERLLVLKKHYTRERLPARGDIVVFAAPTDGGPVVKRVVGLPGEWLQILGTQVFINGKPLEEPYAHGVNPVTRFGRIPDGTVYVLGDNRDNSEDSRAFGPVDVGAIRGRAALVVWPPLPHLVPATKGSS